MSENLELKGTAGIVDNIIKNYIKMEESIVSQLGLYNQLHPSSTGISREDVWLQLFQMIIPKKFVIEHSVFIIDSRGNVSAEVDLAIVDNTYTPYIFQYGKLKFIPIEAVAAVVECKSSDASNIGQWCEKIKKLRTSQQSIVRMAAGIVIDGAMENRNQNPNSLHQSTQTSTRPIRIFCGYATTGKKKELSDLFDFVLLVKNGKLQIDAAPHNLQEWQKELNHCGTGESSQVPCDKLAKYNLDCFRVVNDGKTVQLLSFNFQLNQLLMLINNPILFPHQAYARLFSGKSDITEES